MHKLLSNTSATTQSKKQPIKSPLSSFNRTIQRAANIVFDDLYAKTVNPSEPSKY